MPVLPQLNFAPPKGFQVISFDEFIGNGTVRHARAVLDKSCDLEAMLQTNYELGRKHYSFRVLRRRLSALIEQSFEQMD